MDRAVSQLKFGIRMSPNSFRRLKTSQLTFLAQAKQQVCFPRAGQPSWTFPGKNPALRPRRSERPGAACKRRWQPLRHQAGARPRIPFPQNVALPSQSSDGASHRDKQANLAQVPSEKDSLFLVKTSDRVINHHEFFLGGRGTSPDIATEPDAAAGTLPIAASNNLWPQHTQLPPRLYIPANAANSKAQWVSRGVGGPGSPHAS